MKYPARSGVKVVTKRNFGGDDHLGSETNGASPFHYQDLEIQYEN
jgi:hypothetical protein